jgi:hypothetical protein
MVAENLERLHDGASDPTVGADVAKQLGDLGDEAETLGKNA